MLNRAGRFAHGLVAWLFTVRFRWPNRTKIKSPSKVGTLSRSIAGTAVPG